MARRVITLDEKAAWMRERHAETPAFSPSTSLFAERHYSVAEVAALWNLSQDAVRKIFQNESGVLVLGGDATHKRRYTTLRIPESVLQRVHRRMTRI